MSERLHRLLEILQPERRTIVVDVGASPLYPPPYKALTDIGVADVIAFEPQEEEFQKLTQAKKEHETLLPYALGDGRDAILNICQHSGFTSLLKPNPNFNRYVGAWHGAMEVAERVPIQTRRFDDVDEISDFDFLKIDIQGAETTVFQSAQNKLGAGVAVLTEVAAIPLYEDQPLLDDQMRELRKTGYYLHKILFLKRLHLASKYDKLCPSVAAARNQMIDGDAVFIRNLMNLESLPVEKLKHLAILAEAVFESFDLTVRILQILTEREVMTERCLVRFLETVNHSETG